MAKKYSSDIETLQFGMLVEIPQGCGQPKVTDQHIVEPIILNMGDWVVTKSGRTLSKKSKDKFILLDDFSPLDNILLTPAGERAYWIYGFGESRQVPNTNDRFQLLISYQYSERQVFPKGTNIEYCHSCLIPYTPGNDHHNVIRFFQLTDRSKLPLTFYAVDHEKYLRYIG